LGSNPVPDEASLSEPPEKVVPVPELLVALRSNVR
jgi:hypothetical protein